MRTRYFIKRQDHLIIIPKFSLHATVEVLGVKYYLCVPVLLTPFIIDLVYLYLYWQQLHSGLSLVFVVSSPP